MKVLIIDGYVDEPSYLGVPPYISPHIRAVAGACIAAKADVEYFTIGQVREGAKPPEADLLVAVGGFTVPGKYLRGYPASKREVLAIADAAKCPIILGGPMASRLADGELREAFDHIATLDVEAAVWEFVNSGRCIDRRRSTEEFDEWCIAGAEICRKHPDYGGALIAEIQTYRGCCRYVVGGCSFCVEPEFGEVEFRNPDGIIAEAVALSEAGVRHLRLGGQSCFISYMAEGVGKSETPKPSPGIVDYLLRNIREEAKPRVLHLDNANPAVIARFPDESTRIMKSIVEHCSSGNVLALGMESADPVVIEKNNLNASPEEVLRAIKIMNEIGAGIGASGLPMLLPGLNFLAGLNGETKATFGHNSDFLEKVLESGLLLRRINIRQVIPSRKGFEIVSKNRAAFIKFRRWVRENIDRPMLQRIAPRGTVLREVYLETHEGNNTFGRQVGSYPILVGLPYRIKTDRFVDVILTSHGFRSVTGVEYPLDINRAPLAALSALPKIGEKRARRIVMSRPFTCSVELQRALDSDDAFEEIKRYVTFNEGGRVSCRGA